MNNTDLFIAVQDNAASLKSAVIDCFVGINRRLAIYPGCSRGNNTKKNKEIYRFRLVIAVFLFSSETSRERFWSVEHGYDQN